MQTITANFSGQIRRVTENGRRYIVAPLSLIVPGVLAGSKGPLLYPESEVQNTVHIWNNVPITIGHPTHPVTNQPLSASDDGVWEKSGIGVVRKPVYNEGKARAEGWFDEELTQQKSPAIYNSLLQGQPIELSTGVYTENFEEPGVHTDGRDYVAIARNYRSDHLAILTDQRGACSLSDGCGVHNTSSTLTINEATVTLPNGAHIQIKGGEIVKGPKIEGERHAGGDKEATAPSKTSSGSWKGQGSGKETAKESPEQKKKREEEDPTTDLRVTAKALGVAAKVGGKVAKAAFRGTQAVVGAFLSAGGDSGAHSGAKASTARGHTADQLRGESFAKRGLVAHNSLTCNCGGDAMCDGCKKRKKLDESVDDVLNSSISGPNATPPRPSTPSVGPASPPPPSSLTPSVPSKPAFPGGGDPPSPPSTPTAPVGPARPPTANDDDEKMDKSIDSSVVENWCNQYGGDTCTAGKTDAEAPVGKFKGKVISDKVVGKSVNGVNQTQFGNRVRKLSKDAVAKSRKTSSEGRMTSEGAHDMTKAALEHDSKVSHKMASAYHRGAAEKHEKLGNKTAMKAHKQAATVHHYMSLVRNMEDGDLDEVLNSNPEGINQYSHGARGTSKAASKATDEVRSISYTHEIARKAKEASDKGDHNSAARLHKEAADSHIREANTALLLQDKVRANIHSQAAQAHRDAAKANRTASRKITANCGGNTVSRSSEVNNVFDQSLTGQLTINQGETQMPMTKEQMIATITTNCDCYKGEKGTILNSLSDEQITDILKKEIVVNAVREGFGDITINAMPAALAKAAAARNGDDEDDEDDDDEEVTGNATPKTEAEWMAAAPPSVRATHAFANNLLTNHKQQLVAKLTAHVNDANLKARLVANHMKKTPQQLSDEVAAMPVTNAATLPVGDANFALQDAAVFLGNGFTGAHQTVQVTNAVNDRAEEFAMR